MPVTLPSRGELTLALAGAMDETAAKMVTHAEAMREQGQALVAESARLEAEANSLFQSARVMGAEAGESEAETEEAQDHGMTVNSRGDKVTYEVALDASKRLARFDRHKFAEDLALKPTVASRWIARLREQKAIDVDETGEVVIYEYAGGALPPQRLDVRIETAEERADRLGYWEDDTRGKTVSGTSKRSQRQRSAGSTTGRRRPGRRN